MGVRRIFWLLLLLIESYRGYSESGVNVELRKKRKLKIKPMDIFRKCISSLTTLRTQLLTDLIAATKLDN